MTSDPDRARALLALAERVKTEHQTYGLLNQVLTAFGWQEHTPHAVWLCPQGLITPIRDRPNPLTSRDAAAGAMPEGWRIGHMAQDEDSFYVEAYREEPDNFASAEAPTEPRARTAAALRAMAAEVGNG